MAINSYNPYVLQFSHQVPMHAQFCSGTPLATLDTLGPERTVLIIEVSSFQELKMYYAYDLVPGPVGHPS